MSPPALRVGVNLLWLVPGVVGGTEEYATRMITAMLDARADDIELVLFARPSFSIAHPGIAGRCPTVTPPLDRGGRVVRVLAESTWLAVEARRRRVDLVHHFGGRIPLVSTVPAVVTIHDLQPLDHPENFTRVKRIFLARALPRTARRARAVMTPSEFVRRGVIAQLGIAADKVTALATPVPPHPVASTSVPPALVGGAPFFVFPAITYAHKNHAVLIDAFARLAAERPDVRLVLTGRVGPCEDAVHDQIRRLGLSDSIVRAGRVPRADLDALVDHAVALVFPSRYEGFGLPVVEAMAAGCPVIAADATALPEVVDDAGVLVDPDDVDGWHKAMAAQLEADRSVTGARGRSVAARYDAASRAETLLALYRRVAAASSR